MRRFAFAITIMSAAFSSVPAAAQLPVTIQPDLFPFPGYHVTPGSAVSAGVALADRWLGDEPFANPAMARPWTIALSPMILHVSRQDLRADHRGYEETSAYFDAAGGYLAFQAGALGVALYGYQPVVRLEDNLFRVGPLSGPSGTVTSNSSAREVRGGLALSAGSERWRVGVAGEWTERSDHYERSASTGGPAPGSAVADFSGGGPGGQAGVRFNLGEGPGGAMLGAAVRYIPELDLTGDQTVSDVSGTTTGPISTKRKAGWEGGASLRYIVTDAFHALAAFGGSAGLEYVDWGVTAGPGSEWKLAGEYHDARDPWTVRFGYGQEQLLNVPEPRASVVGLGFGFQFESTQVDVGVAHRTFKHGDHPNSADDRVVFSIVQKF